MNGPLVTVVIAAKDPAPRLLARCLASFATLDCAKRIQLLLVLSGAMDRIDGAVTAAFQSFEVLRTPVRGVYAAYHVGIANARGRYTLLFGVDDIALPGIDAVASQLEAKPFDLFAAACYMQGKGIRRTSPDRRSLIKANWCQQGIFYATSRLAATGFDCRYPIQADHKLNIDIVADPASQIGNSDELVAYFSSGGVSSLRHDLAFIRDFPNIVGNAYGRPLGFYYKWRQRLSTWLLGPLEERYRNPSA